MLLLINKPPAISTFDLIRQFKRQTSFKGKIGHAGTLDVFADGLVILLLDDDTRRFDDFQGIKKTYEATVRLGASSETLDVEGDIKIKNVDNKPKWEDIKKLIAEFPSSYLQEIPQYSATKHQGQALYKIARNGGEAIKKEPKEVKIYDFKLLGYKFPLAHITCTVSSGTYIRQLTFDLFQKIDIDSFLCGLTRTKIGEYELKDSVSMELLTENNWQQFCISHNENKVQKP